MNAHLHAAQLRAQELRAEATRDRDARAARGERPDVLRLVGLLVRRPGLA